MGHSLLQYRSLILLFILLLISMNQDIYAKEETAHLLLKKTAVSQQKARPYVVKKGEWLFDIMRHQLGISSHRFSLIKKFNPQLKNLNKIYPGQIIMLPDKEPGQGITTDDTNSNSVYTTRKGDSISRIASRHLHIKPNDVPKTVKLIGRLNPNIRNLNRIYPGQNLQLPRRSIVITKQDVKASQIESPDVTKQDQNEKTVMPPKDRLDVIKNIISRMNGSFMTTGKYFIPIPQMGQVTIDCSMIPVTELEDGSTILVDFTDRIPDSVKKMIHTNWQNYRVVKADSNENVVTILEKIFNASNAYTMTKEAKPVTLGKNPPIQIMLDWRISKKPSAESKPYSLGLIIISGNSQTLSRSIVAYAERNGLFVSEIIDGRGLVIASDLQYSVPEIPIIAGNSGKDLTYALLLTLGYSPVKDMEVRIFDSVKDGFNLSITADVLVKKGNRQVMIHSKQLPQQFINNLKNSGTDTTFLEEGQSRKSVIEKTLQVMNIPYAFDTFLFSEPEKTSQPRSSIRLPAFKIVRDKGSLYLIDFDMDRDIHALLHNKWEVKIVKF